MYKCPQRTRAPVSETLPPRSIPFLKATFSHLPGIGPQMECRLWSLGILTWEDLHRWLLCRTRRHKTLESLETQIQAFRDRRWDVLAQFLPQRIMWRATHDFPGRTAFLDIETHPMGGRHAVTVVGIWDGKAYCPYVRGRNLDELSDHLARYELVVTFGGTRFDIPVLKAFLGNFTLCALHLDLISTLRTLGFTGGLKKIEQRLGIRRDPQVDGLTGRDAVRLWRSYQAGDQNALTKLIAYNYADVRSLEFLADFGFEQHFRLLESKTRSSGEDLHD